jgi:hypothetical protein
MALPNKDIFQATINTAIAEAKLIALQAQTNPSLFIRPYIGTWGGKYVSSRYNNVFNEQDRGVFDRWEQDALSQTRADFEGVQIDPPTQEQLSALGDGDVANCDAVFKQISRLENLFSVFAVSSGYNNYINAMNAKDIAGGRAVFYNQWRGVLLEFMRLYNMMLYKMPQAQDRPKPVNTPVGHHWERGKTPFSISDWVLVKDATATLPLDAQLMSTVTVAQFKALMADILGGK